MKKHCLWCGSEFKAKPSGQKYCCYSCYVRNHVDRFSDPARAIINHEVRQNEINKTIEQIKTAKSKGVFY